ncbi:MAG: DNA-processing protein DprA [Burkholderiaceae bacterium]
MADGAIDADELAAWVRLTSIPGVGPAGCRALLAAFGLPEEIFSATREQMLRVVSPAAADALRASPDASLADLVARTLAWSREAGNHVLTLADPRYPKSLLEITDPPPLLYAKGRVEYLEASALAIVGSRNATAQGLIDARRFAEALASAGQTIVSGLAAGIDAAAHQGALDAGERGGSTIAVIGTGPDVVYPSAHRALAHRIAEHGLIIGEFPLGVAAAAHHFPRRNRIIAGLSRGVLVIEAAARSGSLITARLAAECGRDVFAIPGSIHSPLSKGCHQLIRQGAKLIDSVSDILEEWGAAQPPASAADAASPPARDASESDDARLLSKLGFNPVTADELAHRAGYSAAQLATKLLDLELAGHIARLPGGRVQRLIR